MKFQVKVYLIWGMVIIVHIGRMALHIIFLKEEKTAYYVRLAGQVHRHMQRKQ